jgi:hypothetical protein
VRLWAERGDFVPVDREWPPQTKPGARRGTQEGEYKYYVYPVHVSCSTYEKYHTLNWREDCGLLSFKLWDSSKYSKIFISRS